MATPELKIRLLLVSEQFTEQMQEASAATSALERSCEGAGAAASGCAQAIDKSAAAAKDASVETTKMASAFDRAQGGVDVLSGSAEIASGSISGLAGGALQTAEGLKKMGFSLAEIRPRLLALAAAASVAALVAKLLQDMAAKAALLDKVRLDNITSGARRLSEEFFRASAAMERAGNLSLLSMTAFSLCVLGTMVSEKFVFRQKIRRRIRLLFACSWDTNRTTKQFRRRWSVRIRILKLKYASIFRKNGLMS